MNPKISLCICTFRRPELLKRCLEEVSRQDTAGIFTYSIVVADNDRLESARQIVSQFSAESLLETIYCVEPRQNIARVRNKALDNADGDFIAFIDDDEFPAKDWLATLFRDCEKLKVDGVLGPVKPFFEHEPPKWVIKGKFCERPAHPTGSILSWRETRTGNVLFRRRIVKGIREPFNPEFGNGGEDQDFFRKMIQRGWVFAWSNEAVVYEVVSSERLSRTYMLKRALLRGQNEKLFLDFHGMVKSIIAVPLYFLLLPFLLLFGQHFFMRYLIRLLDHAGKLLSMVGLKPMGDKYLVG